MTSHSIQWLYQGAWLWQTDGQTDHNISHNSRNRYQRCHLINMIIILVTIIGEPTFTFFPIGLFLSTSFCICEHQSSKKKIGFVYDLRVSLPSVLRHKTDKHQVTCCWNHHHQHQHHITTTTTTTTSTQGRGLSIHVLVSRPSRGAVVPRLSLALVEISNASISLRLRDWTSWSWPRSRQWRPWSRPR